MKNSNNKNGSRNKSSCEVAFFKYHGSVSQIETIQNNINSIEKTIENKNKLHASYTPRPWQSYRSEIRQQINALENQKIEYLNSLPSLQEKRNELGSEIEKCIEEKYLTIGKKLP